MSNISPEGAVKVAVTVDDFVLWDGVPMPDGITPLGITKSIAATLADHGLTGVYGFSHTHRLDSDPGLMAAWEAWVEAGHHLGNHTHLHAPLRWMSGDQYCADIDKAEGLIGNLIAMAPERYFRYAMDMAGETESKRGQVEDHLRASGYRNAPITAWFGDFTWIIPYYRAVVSKDEDAKQMLQETYVSSAVGQLAAHAQLARRLFGQDIPLIWLIHGTAIATDTLGTILNAFVESGVEFVPLQEAMSHPAHFAMPPCNSEFLRNHLQRYAIAAGIPEPHLDPELFGRVITAAPVEGYDTVTLVERKLPALSQGQLLVRADCFSVDPSMIPRLSVDTYAAAFDLGAAVEARAVGRVVQSRADGWSEGDWALYWGGWRDYAVVDASEGIRIQPRSGLPPHTWLHVLGVPGLTAYIGLVDVARMQPGDRVWVSAAAGAVGSVAAQLAKARGASLVIGSAGGAEKARYLTDALGLDAAVDYRAGHLAEQLRGVAPEGIDLYFDNVGGGHLEAAIDLLRTGGRAAICGMISGYGKPPGPGPGNLPQLIIKRLRLEGFLVLDHLHRRAAFEEAVLPLVEDGTLQSDVTMFDDLESAPQALLSLLDGAKLGKALVRP